MLIEETYEYISPNRQQPPSIRDVDGGAEPPRRTGRASTAPTIGSSRAVAIPLRVSITPQLGDYEGPQLGKFKLKKAFKKIGKLVKPLVHVGAAVFTGGASLAVSASMMKAKRDRQSAEKIAAAQIDAQAAQEEPGVSTFVGPRDRVAQLAPSANSVRSYLPTPTQSRYSGDGGESFAPTAGSQASAMPAWGIPVALAGAGLLAVTLLKK